MVADGDKLPESIVVKLFDQVKDANMQNSAAIKDLTRVVGDLTKCIEKQPDLNDMASMCVNRGYECATIKKASLETCKNTKKILGRVTIMIATVCIAFALMVTSYFIVRNSMENMIDLRISETHQIQKPEVK